MLNPGGDAGLDLQVTQDGAAARLKLEAREKDGRYLNGYIFQAKVVGPDGQTQTVQMEQTAPGSYSGIFSPDFQGAYLINLTGRSETVDQSNSAEPLSMRAGWVQSYSPEYRKADPGTDVLPKIAGIDGNGPAPGNPAGVFEHSLTAPPIPQPVWTWLLALAALLVPFDIAVRRLTLARSDFAGAYERIRSVLLSSKKQAAELPNRSDRMAALMGAKERSKNREDASRGESIPNPPVEFGRLSYEKPTEIKPKPPKEEERAREPEENQMEVPSTASILLARKRDREEK